jgi:hypothetical protein
MKGNVTLHRHLNRGDHEPSLRTLHSLGTPEGLHLQCLHLSNDCIRGNLLFA